MKYDEIDALMYLSGRIDSILGDIGDLKLVLSTKFKKVISPDFNEDFIKEMEELEKKLEEIDQAKNEYTEELIEEVEKTQGASSEEEPEEEPEEESEEK